jgi:hypothetical protein
VRPQPLVVRIRNIAALTIADNELARRKTSPSRDVKSNKNRPGIVRNRTRRQTVTELHAQDHARTKAITSADADSFVTKM